MPRGSFFRKPISKTWIAGSFFIDRALITRLNESLKSQHILMTARPVLSYSQFHGKYPRLNVFSLVIILETGNCPFLDGSFAMVTLRYSSLALLSGGRRRKNPKITSALIKFRFNALICLSSTWTFNYVARLHFLSSSGGNKQIIISLHSTFVTLSITTSLIEGKICSTDR